MTIADNPHRETLPQCHERESQAVPPVRSGEAAHTPGPWVHRPSHTRDSTSIWTADGVRCIAQMVRLNDAPVIAAATDMLAALEDIANGRLNVTDPMLANREMLMSALAGYCQDRARAAIRKATGAAS